MFLGEPAAFSGNPSQPAIRKIASAGSGAAFQQTGIDDAPVLPRRWVMPRALRHQYSGSASRLVVAATNHPQTTRELVKLGKLLKCNA
jgi:hypothetical protein